MLEPRVLPLSSEARQVSIEYQHSTERRLRPGEELEPVRGLANRLPAYACRLAAVLSLLSAVDVTEITSEMMERTIQFAEYYASEARRLADIATLPPDLRSANVALNWLVQVWKEPVISLPDLY